MSEPLRIPGFLDAATREEIAAEMRAAGGGSATVYGKESAGAVDSLVRNATRLAISARTSDLVVRLLLEGRAALDQHFGAALTQCEPPQFLRYVTGDYFVAHQDGNTPLIYDDSRFRKVSIVIFLSCKSREPEPGSYGGGALLVHGAYAESYRRSELEGEPGTLVAFRAETTHEVTPVTHGERYTIVSWYR
jgi:predicted 2-oxoglutarate/Fe(II)-dependent dioxygenase YbiX